MALVHADRVKETSTTTGTGTYNLAGAVTGFRTFVAGVATGNTCYYCATDGVDWEVILGTVTDATPDTLSRGTLLASSTGSAINWGAGTRTLFLCLPAGKTRTIGVPVLNTDMPAGSVLQCLSTTYATNASLTTAIPIDDTVPLSTEGTQILSQAITCRDANSKVLVLFTGWGITDVGGWTAAIFRGTTNINSHLATDTAVQANATPIVLDSPASASAQTYTVRVGPTSGNTLRLNGTNAARFFGAASLCTLTLMEIAV